MIRFDLPYLPLGFHAGLVCLLFGTNGIDDAKNVWRKGFILRKNNSSAVVHYLSRKSMIEIVLSSNTDTNDYQDFAKLLKNILIELEKVLPKGGILDEEQIEPFVLMNKQTFAVHSAQDLVKVLGNIDSFDQLFEEVRKMASKINIQNGSYTGDNSQSANNSNNVQQNNNSDNINIEINADQRQQIAVWMEALKKTGKLNPVALASIGEVDKALATPDQPESRYLLGKVWSSLKKFFTKKDTDTIDYNKIMTVLTAIAVLRSF